MPAVLGAALEPSNTIAEVTIADIICPNEQTKDSVFSTKRRLKPRNLKYASRK